MQEQSRRAKPQSPDQLASPVHIRGYTPLASGHTLLPSVTPHPSPSYPPSLHPTATLHTHQFGIGECMNHPPGDGSSVRGNVPLPVRAAAAEAAAQASGFSATHRHTYHSLHALSWQVWEGKPIDCQCYLQLVELVIQRPVQFLCNRSCRWRVDSHPYHPSTVQLVLGSGS